MTSLGEVYERVGAVQSRRRRLLGTGLVAAGALALVVGIAAASTDVLSVFGLNTWQSREVAGVFSGLALPVVFGGVFVVLPNSRLVQAIAAIGAGVSVLGVTLFEYAYPYNWIGGSGPNLTLLVVGVYFIGAFAMLGSVFVAITNLKQRNDPMGTVTFQITRGGETQTVEVDRADFEEHVSDSGGMGGIGLLGETPDGSVETQTNRLGTSPQSDGGATESDIRSPMDDAEIMNEPPDSTRATDRYCGNCAKFQYIRTSKGIRPYCTLHSEEMSDMDACTEWTANR